MTDPNHAAFPFQYVEKDTLIIHPGLSIRHYFAALAMQGMLADQTYVQPNQSNIIAEEAVKLADALIEELNKEKS